MGRLWDDHFRHLGYPSKFFSVQDAGFIRVPRFDSNLSPFVQKRKQNQRTRKLFFTDITLFCNKKKQGYTTRKSRLGMHQIPHVQLNPLNNYKEIWKSTRGQTRKLSPIPESAICVEFVWGWPPGGSASCHSTVGTVKHVRLKGTAGSSTRCCFGLLIIHW